MGSEAVNQIRHPNQQQADALCEHLRSPAEPGEAPGVRAQALEQLATLARRNPIAGLDIDLAGAALPDLDFNGCRFGHADFTDAHFLGRCTIEAAWFEQPASFNRAVFERPASFADTLFGDYVADFGRTRFHADADFSRVRFESMAWFGRGEVELSDDPDEDVWDEYEAKAPVPWDEVNEDDPHWPMVVVSGDYQCYEEGGDGARFNGRADFTDAQFDAEAWFWKARFGAPALFHRCVFGGRVHLAQPSVELDGAALSTKGDEYDWPFGWTTTPSDAAQARLIRDESLAPYDLQLAHPDPDVRLAGLRILGHLADADPALRQRVADAVCEYLRAPLAFSVCSGLKTLTASQSAEVRVRVAAQRFLTDRMRSSNHQALWEGLTLRLSGATLIDFDASGCRIGDGDFTGAQFHGTTTFAGSSSAVRFAMSGGQGHATFHGPADLSGLERGVEHCVFRAD
ncbi:pentapeptide repeat-containing protein [Streptomyces sp. NPDC093149]|uniref:pentapeptide repeat-containing protein n=1 Tax=Streptomyces sp. NPDC093149 TaxID=3366031 RepID=UPI003819127C